MLSERRPPASSPQQARIRSSSGLKVLLYEEIELDVRDGAGWGKAMVVGGRSRSSDRKFILEEL